MGPILDQVRRGGDIWAHLPAGQGRGRFPLGAVPQQKDWGLTAFSAQGKAPGRRQIQKPVRALHLAKGRCQGGTACRFFQAPQKVFHPSGPNDDQPGRVDAVGKQTGAVELAGFTQGPRVLHNHNRSGPVLQKPCQKRKGKAAQSTGLPALSADHFVQGAMFQPLAGGKQVIQFRQPKGTAGCVVHLRRLVRVPWPGALKNVRPLRIGGGCRGRSKLRL